MKTLSKKVNYSVLEDDELCKLHNGLDIPLTRKYYTYTGLMCIAGNISHIVSAETTISEDGIAAYLLSVTMKGMLAGKCKALADAAGAECLYANRFEGIVAVPRDAARAEMIADLTEQET